MELSPTLISIKSVGELGQIELEDSVPEIAEWITFDSAKFELAPQETKGFAFAIDVPEDATPGGYAVTLGFNTSPVGYSDDSNIANAVGVGAILLINVEDEGGLEQFGRILEFEHSGSNRGPHELAILYENTGDSIILPLGIIEIKNMFGDVVDSNVLEDHWLLPDSTHRYSNTWNPRSTFGEYTVSVTVTNIGGEENFQTISFWSFSGTGMVIVVAVAASALILVGLVIYTLNRLRRRYL